MTMKIGGLDIGSMEFNGKSVESVWWGNDLVWGGVVPDIQLDYFTLPETIKTFVITDGEVDIIPYADIVEYTGSELSPNIVGYIPEIMTLSGTTEATNVGTYTCTLTLMNGYYFKSTGTPSINVSWQIVRGYDIILSFVSEGYANAIIDGVTYPPIGAHPSTMTLHKLEGTSISLNTTWMGLGNYSDRTYISYDGNTVASGTSDTPASYTMSLNSNITISIQRGSNVIAAWGYITITTNT